MEALIINTYSKLWAVEFDPQQKKLLFLFMKTAMRL
jgi:hypothetical protein